MAQRGVEFSGKLIEVIASLLYHHGICRDNPDRLLEMPIRHVLWHYDVAVAWKKEVKKHTPRPGWSS